MLAVINSSDHEQIQAGLGAFISKYPVCQKMSRIVARVAHIPSQTHSLDPLHHRNV